MASWEAIHDAIRTRFNAQIAATYSIQTEYDNAPFTLDESALGDYNCWIRFSIRIGEDIQVQMGGSKTYRTTGVAIAQIFYILEDGDEGALQVADLIKNAFRTTTASGVTYRTPYIATAQRESKWYQVNVNIPFYSDDVT